MPTCSTKFARKGKSHHGTEHFVGYLLIKNTIKRLGIELMIMLIVVVVMMVIVIAVVMAEI